MDYTAVQTTSSAIRWYKILHQSLHKNDTN